MTVFLCGLLCATLVRFAPGFSADEALLDVRRGEESLQRLREARAREENIASFYANFLLEYLKGNLGESRLFERPVTELFAQRIPTTARGVSLGLFAGWAAALGAGLIAVRWKSAVAELGTRAGAMILQCIPAAVLGLLLLAAGGRGWQVCGFAVALALYPRIVQYVLGLLGQGYALPHVVTARAKGAGEWRVLLRHVLPVTWPQLLSLAGVSVSMALSAAIPLEMILDVPGLGQLAWQAALGRDLTLLVNVTLLMSVAIACANMLAAWRASRSPAGSAGP
ncbi:MAG: ABC transporter permease subunit [Bryobacteraceae bacterium]|nr:ABC transporter permease subunit [Bryobacteraceae bacterium]